MRFRGLFVLCFLWEALFRGLWGAAPAAAEWPERSLTLVSSIPRTLPWNGAPNPHAQVLDSLVPRLSRELGVPVVLVVRSEGEGVLAGNLVAGSKPDGYLVGALGVDSAVTRVIQGYTPYVREEISPVATGFQVLRALVVRSDFPAGNLIELARPENAGRRRLAHTGFVPVSADMLLALEAGEAAGFSWNPVEVDRLDPEVLLEGRADALVMPLGWLAHHPRADQFKVLTVFTRDENAPCGRDCPTLRSQGLSLEVNPIFAFYLPSKVGWRVRNRLSQALNSALRQEAVARGLSAACLQPYLEDLEGVAAVLNQEYQSQAAGLERLGLVEKP